MKYIFISFVFLRSIISCTNDCVTCTLTGPNNMAINEEWCDDGSTNFTDQNGAIITYDEFILQQEDQGFMCN